MKYIIFVLGLFFCFTFQVEEVQAQKYDYQAFSLDTAVNTTAVTLTSTKRYWDHGILEYHVELDSLSGTPAGTISYQYALDPGGEEWYEVSTDTIANSAETSAQYKVTNFAGFRARIVVTGTGTQSSEVNAAISFKRN